MKKNITLACALLIGGMWNTAFSQQEALFTQYIDAQLYSNAAAAGSNDVFSLSALHRQQWAGLEGAPMTTGIMIHSPLRYESVGLGMEVWNDRLGSFNKTTIAGNFAYRFKVGDEGRLSLGIKGIVDFNSHDFSSVSVGASELMASGLQKSTTPNAGLGILYKSKKWFLGAGIPRILSNSDSTKNTSYSNDSHAYLLAGVICNLNSNWKLRPSLQARYAANSPLSLDVSSMFIFDDKFYIGLNYRVLESVGAIVQYQIAPPFKLGYAFDFGTTSLRQTNVGSHEVMLSYDLDFKRNSVVSPRYF